MPVNKSVSTLDTPQGRLAVCTWNSVSTTMLHSYSLEHSFAANQCYPSHRGLDLSWSHRESGVGLAMRRLMHSRPNHVVGQWHFTRRITRFSVLDNLSYHKAPSRSFKSWWSWPKMAGMAVFSRHRANGGEEMSITTSDSLSTKCSESG